MSIRSRARNRASKIKEIGFAIAGHAGEVAIAIFRESKPDEIKINPVTKEVTFKYTKKI